jgi:transposase
MGCSRDSIRAWALRFLAEGRGGLADRPRSGRPPKLDAAACALLETALRSSPLDYGYPVTIWTVADLHDLLARRGYQVGPATVYRTLQAMGYRYRRPRHDLTHRQDADAVASAKHVLAELQKRGLVPDLDSGLSTWMSATSTPTPHLVQVWQRPGQRMTVPAAGQDRRRAVFGAVDYASGQVVWQLAEHKGGEPFAAFLAQIAQTWPEDHLVLVMDNVSYHRAPSVRAWWAEQGGRITPFWLPVYAPQLNLMERVWRYLKQKLACHRFWADVAGLEAAAATLLSRIDAHFHADTPPGIRLRNNFCEAA